MGSGSDEVLFSGLPEKPKPGLFYYVINPKVAIGFAEVKWVHEHGEVHAHPITARCVSQSDRAIGKIIDVQSDVRTRKFDVTTDLNEFVVNSLTADEIPTLALLHDLFIVSAESPEYVAAALPSLRERFEAQKSLLSDCEARLEVLDDVVEGLFA